MHRFYDEKDNTFKLHNKNIVVETSETDNIKGKYDNKVNVVSDLDLNNNDLLNVAELRTSELISNDVSYKSILDLLTGDMPTDNVKSELKIEDNPAIYPDEQPPMPTDDGNGWKFVNTNPGDKINWYFYAKNINAMDKFNKMEMFYCIVQLGETSQPPWLTAYTFKKPSSSSPNWYESRHTMDGAIASTPSNQKILIYFSPSNQNLTDVFPELSDFDGTTYNLFHDYPVDLTGNGDGFDEDLYLIALSSNSGATPLSYDFTVLEYGVKSDGKLGKRVTLKSD